MQPFANLQEPQLIYMYNNDGFIFILAVIVAHQTLDALQMFKSPSIIV